MSGNVDIAIPYDREALEQILHELTIAHEARQTARDVRQRAREVRAYERRQCVCGGSMCVECVDSSHVDEEEGLQDFREGIRDMGVRSRAARAARRGYA